MKFLFLSLVLIATTANAQTDYTAQRKKEFNVAANSLAVSGYDVVSYFKDNKAVKGNSSVSVVYEGLTYYFSNVANKEAFQRNPAQYEPQYGGWCAYAMGNDGSKVEIDPATFKITNGKLYLFYHSFFNNTLNKWNADEAKLMKNANTNWAKIYKP
jgi:YHS domain-containing protein